MGSIANMAKGAEAGIEQSALIVSEPKARHGVCHVRQRLTADGISDHPKVPQLLHLKLTKFK